MAGAEIGKSEFIEGGINHDDGFDYWISCICFSFVYWL